MTRTLTAGMVTEAQAAHAQLFHLFSFEFSGGTVRLTTAPHDVTFDGNTFQAMGGHLTFEGVQETADLSAQGMRVTLDGVDQTVIALILTQNYIGRKAHLWYAHMDVSTGALVTDPAEVFEGRMNEPFEIEEVRPEDGPGSVTIRTAIVSELVGFKQRRGVAASLSSHQHHYADDTFFQHIATQSSRQFWWGRSVDSGSGGDDGGGDGGGGITPFVEPTDGISPVY